MKKVISVSEVVATKVCGGESYEVCATGEAHYDEADSRLVMDLDSFLRLVDIRSKEAHWREPWLPAKETVRESVGLDDAVPEAKEIFHNWVKRIRQSIPAILTVRKAEEAARVL